MARIPILDENDPNLSPATRESLALAAASRGRLLNIYRALANRPAALSAFNGLAQTVYRSKSTLEPKHCVRGYSIITIVDGRGGQIRQLRVLGLKRRIRAINRVREAVEG